MALENVEDLFDVQVSPDTFWRSQNVQQTFRCACYQDKLERMIFFFLLFPSVFVSYGYCEKFTITLVA